MKYNYLVYGAGRQGTAAVYDLVKNCEAKHVSVVDPDNDALAKALKRLSLLLGEDVIKNTVRFHKNIEDNLLGGFHVALSCAPYKNNLKIMQKVISYGVPFCDLGGNPDVVAQQKNFIEAIDTEGINVSVAPDCGVSPGLSNIIATYLIKTFHADQIIVRCGGIPLKPPSATGPDGLHYKFTFDPAGLISEYSGAVPTIKDGKLVYVDALSSVDHFGEFECAPTSNNSPAVVQWMLDQGVKDYEYRTVRWPGHWSEIKKWQFAGYLCGNADKDQELLDDLRRDKKYAYDPDRDRDRLIMSVVGYKDGLIREQQGYSFDLHSDKTTKFSAMEMTTSWGITIVGYHIAKQNEGFQGPGFIGLQTPEQFIDGGWVIGQLTKRMEKVDQ